MRPHGKKSKVGCLLSPVAPFTSISIAHLEYLFTLSLDKTLLSLKEMWRDPVLKGDLGEKRISCPLAFGRLLHYLLGSFLQRV